MSSFAGGGGGGSAGPGVCGKVSMATQAQAYYATPYGAPCPYVASVTNHLLRRQAVQLALFTVATGSAPNARGANALDIQSYRSAATQVASGGIAVAVGAINTASGNKASAIGYGNAAQNTKATAVGTLNQAGTAYSIAMGYANAVTTSNAGVAIGRANNCKGLVSFACGITNKSYGTSSQAVGYLNQITAGTTRNSAFGVYNIASTGSKNSAFGYLNSITTAVAAGNYNSAFGYKNIITTASSCSAFGSGNSALYLNCSSFGRNNLAQTRTGAVAFGDTNNARGASSSAFGQNNVIGTAGLNAVKGCAFGYGNVLASTAASSYSGAFGYKNTLNALRGSVFGYKCTLTGAGAVAIGYQAQARIPNTVVIQGPVIAPKTNGITAANAIKQLCGLQNVLYTIEIDFTAAAATQTITLPAGSHFFTDAVGVIVEELDGSLTTQISYEFGITGTLAKYLAITPGVALNVLYQEEKWTNLLADAGEVNLTFRITTPGVLNAATKYKGKAFWIGRLVEDEP